MTLLPKGTQLEAGERERARQIIYEQATGVFRIKGVARTSMRELARRCGLGTSTTYDYFAGKGDIAAEYFRREAGEVARLIRALDEERVGARERLHRFLAGLGEFWGKDWALAQAIARDVHALDSRTLL